MKKGQILSILLVVVLMLLAACGGGGGSEDSIKIGFLAPTTSTSAESAKDMVNGFQMFWDKHGMEL
ncbi:MAG: hypothetical protein ACK2UU_02270, partial [Anaerolineae bacterium]